MKNDWIKMTDRRPTEQDLPVWVWDSNATSPKFQGPRVYGHYPPDAQDWTHWRPAKDDIPEPPREDTQADKDGDAFASKFPNRAYVSAVESWHAALAWERSEVAKMLPVSHEVAKTIWPNTSQEQHIAAIESIRARCGGGGK